MRYQKGFWNHCDSAFSLLLLICLVIGAGVGSAVAHVAVTHVRGCAP